MSRSAPNFQMDIEVQRGEFCLRAVLQSDGGVLVLFGPSGSGKSTTLQAIAGLIRPQAGEIRLEDDSLFRRGRQGPDVNLPARLRRTGYVFQDYALFPHMSALGNVMYPLWRQPEAKRRALEQLGRVGLAGLSHRYPSELSGGQQQRVAIARALVAKPRLLLLDEPFAALDLETRRRVRGEIRRILEAARIPVVLVTHDREEALALGDSAAILDRGRVIAQGDPFSLLGHPPRERVARLVGVENVLSVTVREISPQDGVTRCSQDGFSLEVPLTDARLGDSITVGLRADDLILAVERPQRLSARNVIPGTIQSIEPRGAVYAVALDCSGVTLLSHVTRRAVKDLEMVPGSRIWAVVKTASCVVLRNPGVTSKLQSPGAGEFS